MISETAFRKLLETEAPADAIALMCLYVYRAQTNTHGNAAITTAEAAKLLKWSTAKVRRAKNILRNMGMIADSAARDADSRISYHYITILTC